MLTDADLRKKLKAFCKGKTQAAAAKQLNVTPAQLSRTLSGALTTIPARIVKKLGYQAVTVYVPKGRTATKSIKVARDATTGRTVSKATATANPKGTVTETVKRAVKPTKARPKKGVAVRTKGIVGQSPDIYREVADQIYTPVPFARDRANEDLVDRAINKPVYTNREDEVIDLSKKD